MPTDAEVVINFYSPSRPTISLTKTLSDTVGGFFSFEVTAEEGADFIDNSYTYQIVYDSEVVSLGNVRLV